MAKMNVYGSNGQILEEVDLSKAEVLNDPGCKHPRTIEVEDDSIPGTKAIQCVVCPTGWLIKEKIKES